MLIVKSYQGRNWKKMPQYQNEWRRSRLNKTLLVNETATSLSNCVLRMSLLIIRRMKGQNEIYCQPTIASVFDHEPQ